MNVIIGLEVWLQDCFNISQWSLSNTVCLLYQRMRIAFCLTFTNYECHLCRVTLPAAPHSPITCGLYMCQPANIAAAVTSNLIVRRLASNTL